MIARFICKKMRRIDLVSGGFQANITLHYTMGGVGMNLN